jgi:hypothetical protein
MSLNNQVVTLEGVARHALAKAGAIEICPLHSDVVIRVGSEEKERHAHALAISLRPEAGAEWTEEDLARAMKDDLERSAIEKCPLCADLRSPRSKTASSRSGRTDFRPS